MTNQEMGKVYLGEMPFKLNQLEKYLSFGQEFRYFSGESIVKIRDDSFIWYIKSGSFKICVSRSDGTEIDFSYCRSGSILQVNQFVMNASIWDPAYFVATENSVAVKFNRKQFYELIKQDPILFDEYIDNASSYSTLLKQRLLITAGQGAAQRLLTWLDKLCCCQEPEQNGTYIIKCELTQQQIADLLFIHVTTCNKLFSKLSKNGIVRHMKGKLVIVQHDMLREYLEQDWKII